MTSIVHTLLGSIVYIHGVQYVLFGLEKVCTKERFLQKKNSGVEGKGVEVHTCNWFGTAVLWHGQDVVQFGLGVVECEVLHGIVRYIVNTILLFQSIE